jgi:hypothetical protein
MLYGQFVWKKSVTANINVTPCVHHVGRSLPLDGARVGCTQQQTKEQHDGTVQDEVT